MNDHIIPHFKSQDYGRGIVAGVTALDKMARGEPNRPDVLATARSFTWKEYAIIAGVVALLFFTIISLHRSGRHGWAFVAWGVFFLVLWKIISSIGRGRGGGGGFGGGGFGGGFSGGGGASGRW